MVFSTFTGLCNHRYNLLRTFFITTYKNLVPLSSHSPFHNPWKLVSVDSSRDDLYVSYLSTYSEGPGEETFVGTPTMAVLAFYRAGLSTGSWNHGYTELLGGVWWPSVAIQGQRAARRRSLAQNPDAPNSKFKALPTITMLSLGCLSPQSNTKFLPNVLNNA